MGNITIDQIESFLVLMASIIASGGVVLKFASSSLDKKLDKVLDNKLNPVMQKQDRIELAVNDIQKQVDSNTLMTARIDLSNAIDGYPHEHQAILKLAERYFLELHGNSYLYHKFKRWAEQEGVDIAYITEQIDEH